MEEVYKPIEGYENYEISNFGNLKNIKTNTMKLPSLDTHGYKIIMLYKNNKGLKKYIHRLVGQTFIENPENKTCIDHIDRNKTNNHVSNLRWATSSENNMNVGIRKHNTSNCTGVVYNKRVSKWIVYIQINGKMKYYGYHSDFDEAVKIRKNIEKIHFKEFQAI